MAFPWHILKQCRRCCCALALPHAQGFSRAQQCLRVPSTSMSLSPPCSLLSGKRRRHLPSQSLPFLPAPHLRSGREQRGDSSCTISREGCADSSLLPTEPLCLAQPGTEQPPRTPLLMSRQVWDFIPHLPVCLNQLYLFPTPHVSCCPRGRRGLQTSP